MNKDIVCLSVVGGWQSAFKDTQVTFGPSFHKIQDLWTWQAANIYNQSYTEQEKYHENSIYRIITKSIGCLFTC